MTHHNSLNEKTNREQRMAKGTLYLLIAQVIFLGSGYIIHFWFASMVSAEEYGRFGVILSILLISQYFLIRGVPDAVSKFIAEGRDTKNVKKEALKIQLIISSIIFSVIFLSAPYISNLLNDDKLLIPLRLVSSIFPVRALLYIYLHTLNGYLEFKKSSIVIISTHTLKVIFVFLFVFIGFETSGVVGGYILSSFFALIIAFNFAKRNKKGAKISKKEIIKFSNAIILFSFSCIALMNIDLLMIKSLIVCGDKVGYYTAARTLAFIVIAILYALSFTLLPSISKAYSENNKKLTTFYIKNSLRYAIMFLAPVTIIISSTSGNFITLFYPSDYSAAGDALGVLIFGSSFIALFMVMGAIFQGVGKPRIPMIIGIILIPFDVILNYFFIPKYDIFGGAVATVIVGIVAFLTTFYFVILYFGKILNILFFVKIFLAASIIYFIANVFPFKGFVYVLWIILLFTVYFGLLWVLREIEEDDIKILKNILKIELKVWR